VVINPLIALIVSSNLFDACIGVKSQAAVSQER
jgi:hypothetical protein